MKKTNTNKNTLVNKKSVGLIIGILLIAAVAYYGYIVVCVFRQASIEPTRELIITAASGIKKNAPVEPRTGDVYFPGANLYLPKPEILQNITYNFDPGEAPDIQPELRISTDPIWGTTPLYSATNSQALYDAVPDFQACARGIKVVYQQPSPEDSSGIELKHTVSLKNGKTAYVYQETACQQLNDLADSMKNLQSY